MTILLAAAIRPFLLLFILAFIAWQIKWAVNRYMPDSKFKRLLFKKLY